MDGLEREYENGVGVKRGRKVWRIQMPGLQGFKQRAAGSPFCIRDFLWAALWRIGRGGSEVRGLQGERLELGRGCWDQGNLKAQEKDAAFVALCIPTHPTPTSDQRHHMFVL